MFVFDNFQDAPEGSAFLTLMREGLAEIPYGVNVILCSRADPPPDLARFVVNERMGILDWSQLRLSLEETRAIAKSRIVLDDARLREIHARSDGWAAGVTLILEHMKRIGQLELARSAEAGSTVFDYFAGEIFNRAAPELQQLLLRTACSGRITVDFAERITGNAQAGGLLEELYRRHYFTYRRSESEGSYVYHALFREFLLKRARELWPREGWEAHSRHAAALLEDSGEIETAVDLYLEARDHRAATRLIVREAERLLAAGRWQTLGAWMRAFPVEHLESAPWLLFWWGASLIPVNQGEARDLLERSFRGMQRAGDRTGELLAAAGVIEALYFEWATFRPMDQWIGAIVQRLDPAAFTSADAELRVYSALLIAVSCREPGNPLLPRFVDHVTRLLESGAEINRKVTAGTFLLGYCYFSSSWALAERIMTLVRPLARDSALTPLNQLWWRARVGYYDLHLARYDDALRALDEARAIADSYGLRGLHSADTLLSFFKALVAFSRNDLAAAGECLRELSEVAQPTRLFDMWYLQFTRAIMALRRGDLAGSHLCALAALEVAEPMGMIYVEGLSRVFLTHVLTRLNRLDDALAESERARALHEGTMHRHFVTELTLIDAYIALQRGERDACHALLRQGLEHGRRTGYVYYFRWVPETLSAVFAEALAAAIEADHVAEVVRRFGYCAPPGRARDWPRPLQLTALGGFALMRDAAEVDLSQRATRKPLELLKAILALGGRDVDVLSLTELLWPDAEGDAAHKACEITLHRLRKQLGNDRAITLRQGRLAIDPQVCWVDTFALEDLAAQIEALGRPAEPQDPARLRTLAEMLPCKQTTIEIKEGVMYQPRFAGRAFVALMGGVFVGAYCSAPVAQQLPKSGKFTVHSGWKSVGETAPAAGDGRLYGFGGFWGVAFNDKGSGPLHSGPVVCPYTLEMNSGAGKANGECSWSDLDGDRIFTDWSGNLTGGQFDGLNQITGGTGKYAGIQGSAPFQCKALNGNGQWACTQQFEYRLP